MTTYTDLFGQNTVPPADAGYFAVSISANSFLSWENNFIGEANELLAATFVDLTPTVAGLSVLLPSAAEVSTGTELLIKNSGANALNILNNAGSSIASVDPGVIKYFMVTNNTTAAGVWTVFTFGTGTSGADASMLAGQGLQVIASKLSCEVAYQPVNSNYTVQELNRASVIDAATGVAVLTLPLAGSMSQGFYTMLRNSSTGNVTITPSGSDLIDGASSKVLSPNESLILVCTGSSWISVGFGRDVTFVFGEVVVNAASTTITLTSADVAGRMIRVSGTATANVTINLPPVDNIYFINIESGVGVFSVTLTTGSGITTTLNANQRTVVYCDGTNVSPAITTTVTSSLALVDGNPTAPSIAWALDSNTGLYRKANGTIGVSCDGANTVSFSSNGIDFTSSSGLTANNMASALDELKGLVGNYESLSVVTSSGPLTAAQAGSCTVLSGASPLTITLPTLSGVAIGGTYPIVNFSSQSCVVQRASSDLINVDTSTGSATVTSITLLPGDSVVLVAGGLGWYSISSSLNRLRKSGGTMTGELVLVGDATNNLNPVTKQQWDLSRGNFKGAQQYTVDSTIADANVGQVVFFAGASPITLTLPQRANVAAGSRLLFVNAGSANLVISRGGTNSIIVYGTVLTSITLAPNETLELATTTASGLWYVFGGSYAMLKLAGGVLTGPVSYNAEFNAGTSGAAKTINFSNGQKQYVTFTANCTLTFSFPGVGNYILRGLGDGTTRNITWPAGTKFFGGSAPEAPLTSGTAIYTIYYDGSVAHVAGGRE